MPDLRARLPGLASRQGFCRSRPPGRWSHGPGERLTTRPHELFLFRMGKLVQAVESRDMYTGEHPWRVTRFALLLGQQLHHGFLFRDGRRRE